MKAIIEERTQSLSHKLNGVKTSEKACFTSSQTAILTFHIISDKKTQENKMFLRFKVNRQKIIEKP